MAALLPTNVLLNYFSYRYSFPIGRRPRLWLFTQGGLITGDIAVTLNWSSTDVLFYAAITLPASLAITDADFSDAIRLYRILLILAAGFGGLAGFLVCAVLILLSIATTPTFGDFSYFWPLFPFNGKALGRLLFRSPASRAQPSKVWDRNVQKNVDNAKNCVMLYA